VPDPATERGGERWRCGECGAKLSQVEQPAQQKCHDIAHLQEEVERLRESLRQERDVAGAENERAEAAETACDRNSDEIIELLRTVEKLIPWAEKAEDSNNMFTWSYDDLKRVLTEAHETLARIKRPAQVKDGKTSGVGWPE
jgi:chromosome segregation ATPase